MTKTLFIIVGMLAAFAAAARVGKGVSSADPEMVVIHQKEGSYRLIYKGNDKSNVRVKILDADHHLVYEEHVSQSGGFLRSYNLDNLKEGDYTFRVEDGATMMERTVAYRLPGEKLIAQVVKMDDERYVLTCPSCGKGTVRISITDENGTLLYEGNRKVRGSFAEIYNLGGFSGPFNFEITGAGGAARVSK
ncbi:MAG: hypothetical protein JST46_11800 [Bacteroidetes bacterium]|nr:hypothetical protein [Bacteroidota bacterium]